MVKTTLFILSITCLLTLQLGVCNTNVCSAATYYMPDDFSNLQSAMAGLSGGDTLIIRDGVYKGAENIINDSHLPPSGNASKYTTIKAENDWEVVFDGENLRAMFYTWKGRDYIHFQGIKWINNDDASPHITGWNYVKFLKCAFHCGSNAIRVSTVWINNSSYVLLEDCHAWGDGRYSLNVQTSNHVVVRRFVSRLDAVNGSREGAPYPVAHFISYTSQHVEWQNCIALDSDQKNFRSPASYYLGGFATHVLYSGHYTEYNYYRGCVAMNIDMHEPNPNYSSTAGPGFQIDKVRNNEYHNCVVANVVGRGFSGSSLSGYESIIDHSTVMIGKDPRGFGDGINGNNLRVTNSIILNADRAGLRGDLRSDYNVLHLNETNYSSGAVAGANDISSINPLITSTETQVRALKHIVRVEDNSELKNAGSSGDIGANIQYKIGTDGTLYGEEGYKDTRNEILWPFPYEDVIKADMASYVGPPAGNRGFCASGMSLSKYVWDHLGEVMPSTVYGGDVPAINKIQMGN